MTGRVGSARSFALACACAAWLCGPSCADSYRPIESASIAENDALSIERAIEELRFRVASTPSDLAARTQLALLEMRAGRPLAALRELELVNHHGELSNAARTLLGRLYAERGVARLGAGDGQAYLDMERALAMGAEVDPGHRHEARFLSALVALRRGNEWGRKEALERLDEAAKTGREDPRLGYRDLNGASLETLAEVVLWLYRGGAKRATLAAVDRYQERRGQERRGQERRGPEQSEKDVRVLRALVDTRAWWGEPGGAIDVPRALVEDMAELGVSTCPMAANVDQLGCRETLIHAARGPASIAAALREHARSASWPVVTDAETIAVLALLAARGAAAGDGHGTLRWLRERADVHGARALHPEHDPGALGAAQPLILMAAGESELAARTLDRLLAATPDASQMTPGDRLLLACAAALSEHPAAPALIDAAIAALDERHSTTSAARDERLWLAADLLAIGAAWARARDDWTRAQELQRRSVAIGHSLQHHAQSAAAVMTPDWPSERDAMARALARIAVAHLDDTAVGDRLAREFVDSAVYTGARAPAVAALYAALGDTGRAIAWWQEVVDVQPRHTSHLYELFAFTAAAGDLPRARVHLVSAAADSGDAGQTLARAGRWLARRGHPLESLYMNKRALGLLAPAMRRPVIETSIAAMEELGRTDEAERLRAHLGPAVAEESERARARDALFDATDVAAVLAFLDTEAARADPAEARARVRRAMAWNPGNTDLLAARIAQLGPGEADDELRQRLLWTAFQHLADAARPDRSPLSPHAARARFMAHGLRAAWRGMDAGELRAQIDLVRLVRRAPQLRESPP